MSLFNRIFAGQAIDAWASDYTLIAAKTLNQVASDLVVSAEAEIVKATLKDGLIGQGAFLNGRIVPIVRARAEVVTLNIVDAANLALLELVEDQAVWVKGPDDVDGSPGGYDGAVDVAAAAMPLAAGLTGAAVLPFAAVTTTTAWFGLVTTTAISWPVVVGGGALVGLALATGVLNTARIRDRAQVHLRNRARQYIVASLISGTDKTPAVLQQLAMLFQKTAKRAQAI